MRFGARNSIATKLWVWLALFIIALVAVHLWTDHRQQRLEDMKAEEALRLASVLEGLITQEMGHRHLLHIREHIRSYEADPSLLGLDLYRGDGSLAFAPEGPLDVPWMETAPSGWNRCCVASPMSCSSSRWNWTNWSRR